MHYAVNFESSNTHPNQLPRKPLFMETLKWFQLDGRFA